MYSLEVSLVLGRLLQHIRSNMSHFPKPAVEPYKKLVKKHNIDPNLCVFIEDIARNLKPAYEMGMKTIWIENEEPWAKKYSDSNVINYKTNNLAEFLKKVNLLKAA